MPEKIPEQPKTNISWWQDGSTISKALKEPYFLTKGVSAFFARVKEWMLFPLNQSDPLTCTEAMLNIMAWDRDIARFKGESITLFRKRVKYAAINAKDAGTTAGFKAIFERLGVGIVAFKERQNEDWDICTIELSDSEISENSALLQLLIEQYGLTCRRYRFEVSYPTELKIAPGIFGQTIAVYHAAENINTSIPG